MTKPKDLYDEEGYVCLSGERFWKWRALVAELRAAECEFALTSNAIQVEIAKHPVLSQLVQKKSALAEDVTGARKELAAMQSALEAELGVSLKDCAFDDKTGRILNVSADGTQTAPVRTKQRRKGA